MRFTWEEEKVLKTELNIIYDTLRKHVDIHIPSIVAEESSYGSYVSYYGNKPIENPDRWRKNPGMPFGYMHIDRNYVSFDIYPNASYYNGSKAFGYAPSLAALANKNGSIKIYNRFQLNEKELALFVTKGVEAFKKEGYII